MFEGGEDLLELSKVGKSQNIAFYRKVEALVNLVTSCMNECIKDSVLLAAGISMNLIDAYGLNDQSV